LASLRTHPDVDCLVLGSKGVSLNTLGFHGTVSGNEFVWSGLSLRHKGVYRTPLLITEL